MKENLSVRFLYNTVLGRIFLKILTRPFISKIAGWYLSLPASKNLIPKFIKKNNISLSGINVPVGGFKSFNDFFTREKTEIFYEKRADCFISPCDGLLSVVKLSQDSEICVKNTAYTLESLLKDKNLAYEFSGGIALILRLTPSHYHRYLFVDTGKILIRKRIKGILHCVRPLALEKFPIFIENTREYTLIETENFGKIIQMEVGAIMVGKITNNITKDRIIRGEEKGYFEFGGSTIIILLQNNKISLNPDILHKLEKETEVPVKIGEVMAEKFGGNR